MLTHLSILLILGGGVVRGLLGERGTLELRRGETTTSYVADDGRTLSLPFAVRLARFEIETYDDPDRTGLGTLADGGGGQSGSGELSVSWADGSGTTLLPARVGEETVLAPPAGSSVPGGSLRVKVLRYVPDFSVDTKTHEVTSRSEEPRNPAVLVAVTGPSYSNHRWLFARYPDFVMHTADGEPSGPDPLRMVLTSAPAPQAAPASRKHVKSFRSTLEVLEGGAAAATHTVEVNRPLSVGGFRFYQSGYNPDDLAWTSLQVVRDPSVPLVYSGFALMITGLFVVFYLNPWLQGRARR